MKDFIAYIVGVAIIFGGCAGYYKLMDKYFPNRYKQNVEDCRPSLGQQCEEDW